MSKTNPGGKAPDFNLAASNGQTVSLQSFKGKKNVVLYFYPKDDTPGCTVQACGFRDSIKNIEAQDTIVLGVSPDKIVSHEKFIKKFGLPFLLLSDEDHKMSTLYGVWIEKSMYGRKYMGIERSTFVIDKAGKIVKVFTKVKPQGHNEEVLEVLKTL
ncbi:MAG TPA: thioredoxin-dependent thiol peroxidase [Candidatus Omnitrophota bacterium]|nr:thioredoxin-dependent thiol peroxidase [Candidatus Omnitrophota bacterium]